jgi:DNA polymerase bacteriophage-type
LKEVVLHIDIETFSEVDLKRCGMYVYAEHASTELLCMAYRFGRNGPLTLWVPRASLPQEIVDGFYKLCVEGERPAGGRLLVQEEVPYEVRAHVERGGRVGAHNAGFERTVLNRVAGQKVSFPRLEIKQMKCTAAKSRAHGLPGALGDVAKALSTHPKMTGGHGVMLQVCRPKKASKKDPSTRYTPENAPDKFICLYVYCCDDVYAEVDVDYTVPDLPAQDLKAWELDQRINDKGVFIDQESIRNFLFLIEEYKEELRERCLNLTWDATTGEGIEPTQRGKIADWIRANGWPYLSDMQAETVKSLLENERVPKNVKGILRIYSTYGMKAVSKFQTMLDAVCADGRIRGLFIFHGAGPGRWSSVLVQFQNMARGHIDDPEVAIEAAKLRDLAWIKELYPKVDPMRVFASCVRGMIVAPPGKKLLSFDFAGIESRVGAWLAGEEWKLQAFRDYDTIVPGEFVIEDGKRVALRLGPDTYKLSYSRSFRVPVEKVDKKKRQVGKVQELSLLYEGGVGAFVTMTKTYGVKLDELTVAVWELIPDDVRAKATAFADKGGTRGLERKVFIAIDSVKRMWRDAHPAVTQLWRDLKDAAYWAVKNPGNVYSIPNKKIMFCVRDRWLYMKLPSGRKIAYFEPEVDEDRVVSYMGIDTESRRWMRVSTYGGKTLENGDQGFSNCLLRKALLDIDVEYPDTLIMSVHDEGVMEIDDDLDVLQAVMKLACRVPGYAEGLPLAADGWVSTRYKK